MPCFEPQYIDRWSCKEVHRKSLKDRILKGSSDVLNCIIAYLEMPVFIVASVEHAFASRPTCRCRTCRDPSDSRLRCVAEKLRLILPVICFSPLHLPERVWEFLFPPPCSHNRCRLRNYISSPLPWHQAFTTWFWPIRRQLNVLKPSPKQEAVFPFFELPLEMRSQIYLYICHANTEYTIEWGTGEHAQLPCSHTDATTLQGEHDAGENSRQATRTEDATSYQLDDSGILAIHGPPTPPKNLLLTSHRVYEEVQDIFWSATEFEVQPLTLNDASRRDYGLLEKSPYARHIRKVRVRIDVARFGRHTRLAYYYGHRVDACAFEEVELKTCCGRLAAAAIDLCEVLQSSLPMLRVVEIDWIDDFDAQVEGDDLQSRANVLVPFTSLNGVTIRPRNIKMSLKGREEAVAMMKKILDIV